ncbi:hypothetical protein CONPUDRAFT_164556, partial [Coniophora puteana RWD-64-598 SS2]
MQLRSYGRIPGATEAFSQSLLSWAHLETLRCEELTDDALVYLAALPCLKELTFSVLHNTSFRRLRSRIARKPFQRIEDIWFTVVDMDQATQFVSEMGISPSSIRVWSRYNTCSSRAEDLFDAVAKHASPVLKSLIVSSTDESELASHPPSSSFTVRANTLSISSFRPIFKCSHLTSLHVHVACALTLNDQDLIELGRSLPFLKDLDLNTGVGSQTPSNVTFYGFFWLLTLCPHLYHIGISFNAEDLSSVDPTSDVLPEKRPPMPPPHKTVLLFVGESRIQHPQKVAEILDVVFPRLEFVECWDSEPQIPFDAERSEVAAVHSRRWRVVESQIRRRRRDRKRFETRWAKVRKEMKKHFREDQDGDSGSQSDESESENDEALTDSSTSEEE